MDVISYALTIAQIIVGALVTLILALYFSKRLKPFDRLSQVLENVVGDDEAVVNVSAATNSLMQIGVAAESVNQIIQDKELFDGLLQDIAKRAVKIFQMSILGTKSGDVRRMAKAETLVNEAIIDGAAKLNPLIGIALKATGLDEELKKDPEMFGYILQAIQDKGLLRMLDQNALSLPGVGDSATKTTGIEF